MAITLNLSDNFNQLVTKFNQLSATIDSDLDFRNKISVTDAGGDGSLSYSTSTGVITYTGPSASEVRAHISATAPITFTSGVIAANDATTSTKGIASFSSSDFSVTSGAVSISNVNLGTQTTGNYIATIGVTAGTGVSVSGSGSETAAVTISGVDATTTTKGVASFSTTNFTVTSGAVSVKTAGIAEANLVDDAVSRAKLKDEVSLIIYNSAGSALKTLYGAGS